MKYSCIFSQTQLSYALLVLATGFGLGRPSSGPQALIVNKYPIVNRIPQPCRSIHCIHWYLSFNKHFGLMIACLGRNWFPKLIKYKIVCLTKYIFYSIVILCLSPAGFLTQNRPAHQYTEQAVPLTIRRYRIFDAESYVE
jgi:hypothetical protein